MIGYLAAEDRLDHATLRKGMARGSVVASFVIESFSIHALASVKRDDIERRLTELVEISEIH